MGITEKLVHAAVESAPTGILLAGLDGRPSYANRAFVAMWGLGRDLPGAWEDLWQHRLEALAALEALRRDGRWEGMLHAHRRDGSTFATALKVHLLRDHEERPSGLMALCSDVAAHHAAPGTHLAQRPSDASGHDVEHCRRTERELLQSTARLNEAQRVAQIGSWELDVASGLLTMTDEVYRILEVDRSTFEPTLENASQYVHPDYRERLLEDYSESIEKAEPYEAEFPMHLPDGRAKWLRMRCDVKVDGSGRVVRSTGTVQDVTRQLAAEERIRAAYRLLQSVIDATPDWIFATDLEHRFLMVNAAFARAHGLKPRDVVGRPDTGFLPRELRGDRPLTGTHTIERHALERDGVHDTRLSVPQADGSSRVYDVFQGPLRDAQGVGTGVFTYVRDVTERRRAEERLRASEARFAFLLGSSPAVLYTCRPDGDFAATYVSPNVAELFGIPAQAFLDDPGFWAANIHPEDVPGALAVSDTLIVRDQLEHQYRFRRGDGEYRWIHDSLRVVRDDSGAPVELVGFWIDVDARRKTEAELERYRKDLEDLVLERTRHLELAKAEAERASRAKSEFLSRMSHELRTPMNAILGFSQALEMDSLPAKQRRFVGEIQRAGQHLLELIDDLLDVSRIENGRISLSLGPVSVDDVIAQAVQIVWPLASGLGVQLGDAAGMTRAHVTADRVRLRQILVNLMTNAAKYNRPGGSISVECRAAGSGRLRLLVSDTGRGIAASSLDRLFEPFERLGAEATGVDGTGIGLALSKQLAQLMGGSVGAESTLGEGSTFWVELPVSEASVAPSRDAGGPAHGGASEARILYVEDNPVNLEVVEAMLGFSPGLRMLSARCGEEGLELARRERPDAILLDIHLPGMDGYAVLRALRQDAATRNIPVIALSADAMPEEIECGLEAGFASYLTKPVSRDRLISVLEEVLHASRAGAARDTAATPLPLGPAAVRIA